MVEYVTISEFAKRAKVSSQSIYKRLKKKDNPIQPFIKLVENGKILISLEALSLYIKEEEEKQPVEEEKSPVIEDKLEEKHSAEDVTSKLIEMLQRELEEKSEQLKVKDKQITDLNERLAETNQRLAESQQMLNQQQYLNGIAEQKILALESKTAESEHKKKWWKIF